MSYSKYYSNKYDDIFTMLKKEGYNTSYMHGNYGYFWNRGNVYKSFGVDNLELKDKFEDTSENIMGYLSDELLYKQAVEKLGKLEYEEIFFFAPALVLGGAENIKYIKKGNGAVHHQILLQMG